MDSRLPKDAATYKEVFQYYTTRAKQLLADGYVWCNGVNYTESENYFHTWFAKDGETFVSIFLPPESRNKGIAEFALNGRFDDYRVITVPDCDIEEFLMYINKAYVIGAEHTETTSYQMISDFYGDKRANRSKVFLMNHIDEGILILRQLGASQAAIDGYCLHPILQGDVEFVANRFCYRDHLHDDEFMEAYGLAIEYRKTAMGYLSKHPYRDIELSPLNEVNQMLIADKVQNRKDFELYHKGTHENSDRLTEYFAQWLRTLGISEAEYFIYKAMLDR